MGNVNGILHNINNNKKYELKDGNGFIKEYYEHGILKFESEYINELGNRKG